MQWNIINNLENKQLTQLLHGAFQLLSVIKYGNYTICRYRLLYL
jgi:hypothetical protein